VGKTKGIVTMRNLITDVPGVLVGNADEPDIATGATVALFEEPAVGSVAILGGAPATRDTTLLEPEMTVERVDAIILSGGSAFGLDAAGGVMQVLAARGRGFGRGSVRTPIVPQAILFDLSNGGDKSFTTAGDHVIGVSARPRRRQPVRNSRSARQAPDTALRPSISREASDRPAQ
jgi:L-aminopeptidase/D-esterase-like protein